MKKDYFTLDISLFLLSASVIGYQLTLMQILSIQQWHYMAFMVITIALLGFGASGTILAIFKKHLLNYFSHHYTTLLLFTSIAMVLTPIVASTSWLQFDTYLLFIDFHHILRLMVTCLLYFIPFLFAAIAIGMSFTHYADKIGKLYFANLMGSGVGAIITVLLMWIVMPHYLPTINATFPFLGVLIYSQLKPKDKLHKILFVVTILILMISPFVIPQIHPSQYKSWSKTIRLPNAKIQTVQNSPYGLVQTVTSSAIRYAPSTSIANTELIPIAGMIFINGESAGYFPTDSTNKLFSILNSTPSALIYHLKRRNSTLILKSGMGEQIHLAILNHSGQITAIELNPIMQKITKSYFNICKQNAEINFQNLSVRAFLKTDTAHYNAIIFPTVGSFYGTTGLYAIEEQNQLTIEAFNEAWEHLTKDGVLCVSSWLDYPFRSSLKLVATLDEVLKTRNIDTSNTYLIGIKNWNLLTLLMKRTPFSDLEIKKTIYFCDSLLFDPVLINNTFHYNREPIHTSGDTLFNSYLKQLTSSKKDEFYRTYPFRTQPSTDNKPYFSQFLKVGSIPSITDNYNIASIPYFELGYLVALITLVFLIVLGILFIIIPLIFTKQLKIKPTIFIYFSAIGIGFMVTEMVFIHQFIIYFGNPIYSVSIIISILMISSGAGSFFSPKIASQNTLWISPLIISIVLGLYLINLQSIINISISHTFFYKITICSILVGSIGFFMGIPFPSVIKVLGKNEHSTIPAAWAINGFFSVFASPTAVLLSIEIGFTGLFFISASSYLLASLVILKTNWGRK